jgi:hypothetical protein
MQMSTERNFLVGRPRAQQRQLGSGRQAAFDAPINGLDTLNGYARFARFVIMILAALLR